MKFGIVVTSRSDSARVPRKAFRVINGVPLIEHLLRRCIGTGLQTILAIPTSDYSDFHYLTDLFPEIETVAGHNHDPMGRLLFAAQSHDLDAVIRVCHDKIFIDKGLIELAVETFKTKNLDYLYSSEFTAGSGFEVISREALTKACASHKDVEHVSYAIKNTTSNTHNLKIPARLTFPARLLVDYPEDLTLLEVLLSVIGNKGTLQKAIDTLTTHQWMRKLNQLPICTIYTCAYNAEKWIDKCIGSVMSQRDFKLMEYILVDDFSSDKTPQIMAKMAAQFPNIKFIRNPRNLGLASSSNIALSEARGKYLLRLDADDFLVYKDAIDVLITEIESTEKDAIYPNNYYGSLNEIQSGKEQHHVGGTLFRRSAVNHVKFTEQLRNYEGLDFFVRAKDQINIGYYGKPTFFYRQHDDSMSKTNLSERARVKAELDARA